MKIVTTFITLFISFSANAGFVHPMDFNGSEAQKKK